VEVAVDEESGVTASFGVAMLKFPEARSSLVENPERTGSLGLHYGEAALRGKAKLLMQGRRKFVHKALMSFGEYFPKEAHNDDI
jgi:hypothetical protein